MENKAQSAWAEQLQQNQKNPVFARALWKNGRLDSGAYELAAYTVFLPTVIKTSLKKEEFHHRGHEEHGVLSGRIFLCALCELCGEFFQWTLIK